MAFVTCPQLGEHPRVLPGQGRRLSDPKVLLRLLPRDKFLHCHTLDVTERDSPALRVPFGRARAEQCWDCPCTRGQNGCVEAAEEEHQPHIQNQHNPQGSHCSWHRAPLSPALPQDQGPPGRREQMVG